jgi:hypothetical protein
MRDLLLPIGLLLFGGGGLILITVLPGMIANGRKAARPDRIRQLSLLGVVLATFGFLWGLLGRFRAGPGVLIVGIIPGAIVWLIAVLWACFARPAEPVRGFEVQPLSPRGESKNDEQFLV